MACKALVGDSWFAYASAQKWLRGISLTLLPIAPQNVSETPFRDTKIAL
jgi:hypothetical protein